jgi:hypothetical protein
MASFDLPTPMLAPTTACLARPLAVGVLNALSRAPFSVCLDHMVEVDLETEVGPSIRGQYETYSPFLVRGVIAARLNREPSPGVKGVPPEVFRLRKAFEALNRR